MRSRNKKSTLPRILLGAVVSWPTWVQAIDWSGATGAFGTGTNWVGGSVPTGTTANITNSGSATIATGNNFSVTTLSLGNFSGTGTITQNGGAITATSQVMIGGTNTNGGSGTGTYTISGGTLTSSGSGEFWVGSRGGTGTLLMSDNSVVTASSTTNVGRDASGKGTLTISDTAEFKSTANDINVGVNTGNAVSIITVQNSGKLTCGREITVGYFGSAPTQGTLTMKDNASVSTVLAIVIGKLNSAKGVMTVSDNATVNCGTWLIVGADSTGANGSLTVSGNATVNSTRPILMGVGGSTAALTLTGGTLTGNTYNGEDGGAGFSVRGGTNTIALNGGTLVTPGFNKTGGTVALALNGSQIKATGSPTSGDFFNGFSNSDITVQAGGANIDSNGHEIQTARVLSGPGGLVKTGLGSLNLNGVCTYSGSTLVTGGKLGGTGGVTGNLNVGVDGTVSPGGGIGTFTAGPTNIAGTYACEVGGGVCDRLAVNGALDITSAKLVISEVASPSASAYVIATYTGATPGPFSSITGMPAGYHIDYHYEGQNQIVLVQSPGGVLGEWMANYYPGETDPLVIGPGADPDNDGHSNALELMLGGAPNLGGSLPGSNLVKPAEGSSDTRPLLTIAVRAGMPAFVGSPAPFATKDGYTCTVLGSADLTDTALAVKPVATVTTGLPAAPAGYEYRTFAFDAAEPASKRGFFRVKVAPYDGADVVVGNFDGATYQGWTATGTAFNGGPATGATLVQLGIQNAQGGVATSKRQGDGPQGRLVSEPFVIQRSYVSFSIAGGDYERHACLNLIVNGKVVKSATGRNSDTMAFATWDARPWLGQSAQVEIVDEASGGWGHVNVGNISQTDIPSVLPINKGALYQESLRPKFHFTAKQHVMDRLNPGQRQDGWLNDLNGMIYYDGEYHMFAQRWNKCWIHAVSTDLVHWQELDPAFWEEQLDSAVQSGTCVIDYNNSSGLSPNPATPPMVAFWSRNSPQHCITYSLDKGRTWTHYAGNPIITGFSQYERDPKVFWHAASGKWVMILYGNNQYHILNSTNLLNWTSTNHPIGNSFECPDFFELPVVGNPGVKKWALIRADGTYTLGNFDGAQFTEETSRLTSDRGGTYFYATQTFENVNTGDGRRIQMAWMRDSNFPNMPFSQQVSFPCEVTLRQTPAGLRIYRRPIPEISILQEPGQTWTNTSLASAQPMSLAYSGDAYRVTAQVSIPAGSSLSFNLRGHVVSFGNTTANGGSGSVTLQSAVQNIEILMDRASVETFANDGEYSCTRYFAPNANGITASAQGGTVTIQSMEVHPVRSMWEGQ